MKIRFIGCLLTVLILVGHNAYASHSSDGRALVKKLQSNQDLYTAYNLYAFGNKVHSINYKHGKMIPVGTKIKKIYFKSYYLAESIDYDSARKISVRTASENGMVNRNDSRLTFVTDDDIEYHYIFKYRHHPRKSFAATFSAIIATEDFSQQSKGFNSEVVEAIKKGVVIEGMTRAQVIMAMGYPPEHKTPSIDSPEWLYWMDKTATKKICFNHEALAIECGSDPAKTIALPPAENQGQDINSRFETLAILLKNGLISEEDYKRKKEEILKDL